MGNQKENQSWEKSKIITSVACHARRENGDVEKIPKPVGQAQTMHERSPLKETAVIGDELFLTRIPLLLSPNRRAAADSNRSPTPFSHTTSK
jgi:hypothetical protein